MFVCQPHVIFFKKRYCCLVLYNLLHTHTNGRINKSYFKKKKKYLLQDLNCYNEYHSFHGKYGNEHACPSAGEHSPRGVTGLWKKGGAHLEARGALPLPSTKPPTASAAAGDKAGDPSQLRGPLGGSPRTLEAFRVRGARRKQRRRCPPGTPWGAEPHPPPSRSRREPPS